jgi:hypothetical protein
MYSYNLYLHAKERLYNIENLDTKSFPDFHFPSFLTISNKVELEKPHLDV